MSPPSPPDGLPNSWDFVEDTKDNRTVSSIEAVESAPACIAPFLSAEQALQDLHGSFKSTHPWKEQIDPHWIRIRTLHSGAAKSIAPLSMAIGVRVEASEMSSRGQSFITAGDGRIQNSRTADPDDHYQRGPNWQDMLPDWRGESSSYIHHADV